MRTANKVMFYCLTGMLIGGIAEGAAWWEKWWIFSPAWYLFIQIFLWEGMAMGGLAFLLRVAPIPWLFVTSAVIGGGSELVNILWFNLWRFPEDRFLFFHGTVSILIVMTVAWSSFLPFIVLLNRLREST